MSSHRFYSSIKILLVYFLGFYFASCINNNTSKEVSYVIKEADYPSAIIGSWDGTIEGSDETMHLKENGTFICYIHKLGFIANTLSQSLPGTVRGNRQIAGTKIEMEITGEKNELVKNLRASSRIMLLKKDVLLLMSDKGDTTTFRRVSGF